MIGKGKKIKKAYADKVQEATSHPNGPSLDEMLSGEEEKAKKRGDKGGPDSGPIPVI